MSRIFVGEAAEARLRRLGLPGSEVLVQAIEAGEAAARSVTAYHPAPYRGNRLWAEATAFLRFSLEPRWEPEFVAGADIVVERERGAAIIVTKGDGATGDPSFEPQVSYERGEVIQTLVNGSLDTLFTAGSRPEWEVWFLLHNLQKDSCPAELSRPLGVDRRGWVSGWESRVLLPTTGHGPSGDVTAAPPTQPAPAIDVTVTRRVV
jgi:hypothetical protein